MTDALYDDCQRRAPSAGLAVFHVFFFAITVYRVRRMSEHLAQSLAGITRMTAMIGQGVYDHQPDPVGLIAIDAPGVARLGRELGDGRELMSGPSVSIGLYGFCSARPRKVRGALVGRVAR